MNKTLLSTAIAAALATSAFSAMAEDAPASPLTASVAVVSDYLFRGVSQTHGSPALQGTVQYAFSNGFYVGAFASNITWVKDYTNKGNLEVDLFGGYKGNFTPDLTYDLGLIGYSYPDHGTATAFGQNPTTSEAYFSLGYKEFSAKYSHVLSTHFISWYNGNGSDDNTRGSGYLEANWAHDLGEGWGVSAHLGHQKVNNLSIANYTDFNVGVTKDVGFGVVGLTASTTNAKGSTGEPYNWPNGNFAAGVGSTSSFRNVAKSTAVLSFTKNF